MGKAGLARVWLALDRMTCEKLITHIEQPNSSRNAHLKPLLRAHFLREQDGGDAEHGSLPVDETPAQSDVSPDGLHHAQAEGVEGVPDSHGRELVLYGSAGRLQPRHKGLIALEPREHVLCAGELGVRPGQPWPHNDVV